MTRASRQISRIWTVPAARSAAWEMPEVGAWRVDEAAALALGFVFGGPHTASGSLVVGLMASAAASLFCLGMTAAVGAFPLSLAAMALAAACYLRQQALLRRRALLRAMDEESRQ